MLQSQKLTIRLGDLRKKLAELAAVETLTDEQRAEIAEHRTALSDCLDQRNAALLAEADEAEEKRTEGKDEPTDPEERERLKVLGESRIGNVLRAVVDGRPLKGAEAELRSASGLTGDHEVPLALFEPRAATESPSETPVDEAPVQPYIYREGVAGYLGIDMPVVGPGTAHYPVLTRGTPAGPKAEGAAADETAATFSVQTSTPRRVTGAFRVRVEDMAVFPQLEDSLRRDIPMSLANAVAEQILNGDGVAPNVNGLLKRLSDPDAAGAKNTPQTYVETVVGALDGRHGYELRDLRTLVGKATYAAMAGLYFTGTSVSTAAYLADVTGGVRMSDRIAAVNANVQAGIVRVGLLPMSAVAAVWGGVQLIRDPYSSAGSGEVVVTALQLMSDVHVLRSGAFAQVSFYP